MCQEELIRILDVEIQLQSHVDNWRGCCRAYALVIDLNDLNASKPKFACWGHCQDETPFFYSLIVKTKA